MAEDVKARKLRFMRFSLTAVVAVVFAASAAIFYVTLGPLATSVLDVLFWPVLITVVTAFVCVAVYYGYRAYLS